LLYKGVTCAFFNLSGKTLLIYWHIYNTCENIGKDTVYDPSDHPSLIEIKKQNDGTQKNVFEKVTTDKVEKIMNNLFNFFFIIT
jgi:GH43 family beta-xylosidase